MLEFVGSSGPGWRASYTDNPVYAGTGRPIDVAADAALRIQISMGNAGSDGEVEVRTGQWDPGLAENEEIHLHGWFEGYMQLILGVGSPQPPFRVFTLNDPTRVVTDVVHVEG